MTGNKKDALNSLREDVLAACEQIDRATKSIAVRKLTAGLRTRIAQPIGRPRLKAELRIEARQLQIAGKTQAEIAKCLGISQASVSGLLNSGK